jgi:predicted nucleic acid-binding protein
VTVLVDTSALYALLDRTDASHPAARSIFARLAAADAHLVTHSYVVVEAFALTQRRLGDDAVRRLALELLPVIEMTWVERELHERAVAALLAATSRASLVDRVSFELMRERGIEEAFAFDRDFEVSGFRVLA